MVIGHDLLETIIGAIDDTKDGSKVRNLMLEHIANRAIDSVKKAGIEVNDEVSQTINEILETAPKMEKKFVYQVHGVENGIASVGDYANISKDNVLHSILCLLIENYGIEYTPLNENLVKFFAEWSKHINDNMECIICVDFLKGVKLYSDGTLGKLFNHYDVLGRENILSLGKIRRSIAKESHDIIGDKADVEEKTTVKESDAQAEKETIINEESEVESEKAAAFESVEKLKEMMIITQIKGEDFSSDPLIGRENEVNLIAEKLLKKKRGNVIMVGDPGVGKTEIMNGLVYRMEKGLIGGYCNRDVAVYGINISDLMAGTRYRGELESKIQAISITLRKISEYKQVVLYIDEIHLIVGTGAGGNSDADIGNLMKPLLTEGKVRVVGSTTFKEYNRIKGDAALDRRFEIIKIEEPSRADCVEIMKGIRPQYEEYFGIQIEDKHIEMVVNLAGDYIKDKCFPDKALDSMDSILAYAKFCGKESIDDNDIIKKISEISRIDINRIRTDNDAVMNLGNVIRKNLYGQDKAIDKMVNIIKAYKAGFNDEGKTIANVLFSGKTGTGKTELCKLIAENMGMKLIRFDMSEYTEEYSVSKLIGSPAGYVGYKEGGLLTEEVSKEPHCILLLDEIEKAHPKVLSVFLQVMDYGKLTDSQGKKVDFTNVIVVMTSNAGADFQAKGSIGFGADTSDKESDISVKAIERDFAPEFLGRLDEIVRFNNIDNDIAVKVVEKEVNKLVDKAEKNGYKLSVSDNVKAEIIKRSNIEKLGARNIGKEVQKSIKPLVVDYILGNNGGKEININEI